MKLLFLDIDGVLNSRAWYESRLVAMEQDAKAVIHSHERLGWEFDPACVERLQKVVDATNCKIVVSSSWRIGNSLVSIRAYLLAKGLKKTTELIDVTPQCASGFRGEEVWRWFADRGLEPENYAIVDDDADFWPHQPLIKTDNAVGLTDREVELLIETLGRV